MPLWNPQYTLGSSEHVGPSAPPPSEPTIGDLVPGTTPSQNLVAVMERLISMEEKIYRIIDQKSEYEKVTQSIGKSPLSQTIRDAVLPPKFHNPKFRGFDGGTDPHEHITQYEQVMESANIPKEALDALKCKMFAQSLRGPALE